VLMWALSKGSSSTPNSAALVEITNRRNDGRCRLRRWKRKAQPFFPGMCGSKPRGCWGSAGAEGARPPDPGEVPPPKGNR
jgi:hypothetical protein